MTMKELSQLHWLNVEIDRDKQRLAELEARATSPGGPNMSGMPGGGGAGSSVESDAIAIIDLKEQIRGKLARAMAERDRITAYLDSVDRRVGCILIAVIIILHCGFRAREFWALPRSCFPRCHLQTPLRE